MGKLDLLCVLEEKLQSFPTACGCRSSCAESSFSVSKEVRVESSKWKANSNRAEGLVYRVRRLELEQTGRVMESVCVWDVVTSPPSIPSVAHTLLVHLRAPTQCYTEKSVLKWDKEAAKRAVR